MGNIIISSQKKAKRHQMAKTKRVKKQYPTDIPLAENVRLLKCGAWGYIYEGNAIFRSKDVEKVNEFSNLVKSSLLCKIHIKFMAENWQILEGEPKILPQCHLCDAATWRVEGNNYGAVIRQKY